MTQTSGTRRQLVVCCDGTNNTLTGARRDTNVLQLHNLIAADSATGCERVLYYDPGVGNPGVLPPTGPFDVVSRTWDRLWGLASGSGVYEDIASAYLFLMRNWRGHEDEIYIFGFSRGAFTARAVAGMVNLFGIVRPEYESMLPTLLHIYFSPPDEHRGHLVQRITRQANLALTKRSPQARSRLIHEVQDSFAGAVRRDAWVRWICVWDTVESVGLPGPLSRVNPTPPTVRGKRYLNVRHALSLDEHRWSFLPRLYAEPSDLDEQVQVPWGSGQARQTLQQRWYPGVHSDIGGGYRQEETGISQAALRWMLGEVAGDLGLAPPAAPAGQALRHDPLYSNPFWAVAGMTLRNMDPALPGGQVFTPVPATALPARVVSIWDEGGLRSLWTLLSAAVGAAICLAASGLCLAEPSQQASMLREPWLAWQAAAAFAREQLIAIGGGDLVIAGRRPWELQTHPGWAMFWDLGFIGGWAYLLGRIASRAFAWMAGARTVSSGRPLWLLLLGAAPVCAVLGDVFEDLCLWAALASNWAGSQALAVALLSVGSLGSVAKLAGLLACAPLLVVRVWAWPHPQDDARKPAVTRAKLALGLLAVLTIGVVIWRSAW